MRLIKASPIILWAAYWIIALPVSQIVVVVWYGVIPIASVISAVGYITSIRGWRADLLALRMLSVASGANIALTFVWALFCPDLIASLQTFAIQSFVFLILLEVSGEIKKRQAGATTA